MLKPLNGIVFTVQTVSLCFEIAKFACSNDIVTLQTIERESIIKDLFSPRNENRYYSCSYSTFSKRAKQFSSHVEICVNREEKVTSNRTNEILVPFGSIRSINVVTKQIS